MLLLTARHARGRVCRPRRLALSNARHMYWTVAQLVAHHTSNGCNLQPGDLLGTGTISAPDRDGCGSLLEITQGGKRAARAASGETRRFLEDGDEIILSARASRAGFAPIGFGECRGRVEAAVHHPQSHPGRSVAESRDPSPILRGWAGSNQG